MDFDSVFNAFKASRTTLIAPGSYSDVDVGRPFHVELPDHLCERRPDPRRGLEGRRGAGRGGGP